MKIIKTGLLLNGMNCGAKSNSDCGRTVHYKKITDVLLRLMDMFPFTSGLVLDMWTEKANDGVKYKRIADQSDFDKF